MRWLMASDVCKHCTDAACLDVCPTGALFRTEFGTVVVQQDVCNGCGYCVPACPFGVLDRREEDGRVWKCTLCYDRLKDDMEPACAQACPTNSIQFGELDDLRDRAEERLADAAPRPGRRRRASTAPTTTTASAAPARSSCCSTSPRSTACRPTRSTTTRDLGEIWAAAGAAARRARRGRSRRRCSEAGRDERRGRDGRARGGHAPTTGGRCIKPPVWTPEIPIYFFTGGIAGASAGLALPSDCAATTRWRGARGWSRPAVGVSPALLISDLGRPERFLNMLRMFKVTSPMSVGSWVLVGSGLTTAVAAARRVDRLAARAGRAAGAGAVGGARPAARDVHGGAPGEHGRAGLARGAAGPAVPVRRRRGGERECRGPR